MKLKKNLRNKSNVLDTKSINRTTSIDISTSNIENLYKKRPKICQVSQYLIKPFL